MSSASSKHSLFIFGHTRWSIHIILSTNNRLFLPVCFPRLWNQLPASLCHPRTNLSNFDSPSPSSGTSSIGSIDSPLLSSKPLLSFSGETPRIPRTVYRYFWAYPFLVFWFFCFPLFSFWRFGERGFSYCGPAAWITLPSDLHDIADTGTFRKRLKSTVMGKSQINS